MRSRYAAYATQNIAYIVQTTVPAQQHLLDTASIAAWSEQATWLVFGRVAAHCPHQTASRASGIYRPFCRKRTNAAASRMFGICTTKRALVFY